MSFKASAPGSLMLLGEYAVLYGKPAVVCAVDKRMIVTLTPRADQRVIIESALGTYETDLLSLKIEKPFHFVLATLKHFQTKYKRGCDINVTAEFSDKIGFGSSAAVTVATLATLVSWLEMRMTPIDMLHHARNIIRSVQGVGSGADAAASIYGGIVSYQQQPIQAEKFSLDYPLTVLYAGFKTPTVEAIQRVQDRFATQKTLFRHLMNSIGQCAVEGATQLRKENWQAFGDIMKVQQGLMDALGVNVPELQACVSQLQANPSILGAKISGSGFGDCAVGLGHGEIANSLEVSMTTQGVQCEKI